jgi:predicted HTH domain antitoxin
MVKMGVLSVRLGQALEDKLEFLMKKRKIVDKSAYVRQLISKSLTEDLMDYLCEQVGKKNLSAWKAADIAEISLRAMLKELARRNIASYDESALEADLKFLEKGI